MRATSAADTGARQYLGIYKDCRRGRGGVGWGLRVVKAAALKLPCLMSPGGSPLTRGAAAVHKHNHKYAGCTSKDKMKIRLNGDERIMREFRRPQIKVYMCTMKMVP